MNIYDIRDKLSTYNYNPTEPDILSKLPTLMVSNIDQTSNDSSLKDPQLQLSSIPQHLGEVVSGNCIENILACIS